jgi:Tol biopolymer transport system component
LILFAEHYSGLFSIPVMGGVPAPVTTLDRLAHETNHRWPQFLPDGQHFLYLVESANHEREGVYVGSLDSRTRTRVMPSSSPAVYASGYLLFARDQGLQAQPFDPDRLRLSGVPSPVASDLEAPHRMNGGLTFSAAGSGLLAYMNRVPQYLVWLNRQGEVQGQVDTPTALYNFALSKDEQLLAAQGLTPGPGGVWMLDLRRGGVSRVVTDGIMPLWSPDGGRIAFSSLRATGVLDLYHRPLKGDGRDELMLSEGVPIWAHDWSPDGRYIVYARESPVTRLDLWLLPLAGAEGPQPFLQTPFNEFQGKVSPNGHWIAYTSDESGAWEVYVQSFPVPGEQRMISTHGGAQPQWRRDGRELFYLAPDRKLMAVDVTPETLDVGIPRPLFQTRIRANIASGRNDYVVTADGQRFLVDRENEHAHHSTTVVLNWASALKK